MDNNLMTADEITEYLKISKFTLYRWIKEKNVPTIRMGGVHRFKNMKLMIGLINSILGEPMNKCVPYQWHESLVDDCKAIITETVYTSRWALVEGYHALGQRILQDIPNLEKQGIKGGDVAKHMSSELGKSTQTVYNAVALARQFPDINKLPYGKNISWHKVCNEVLPNGQKEPKPKKLKKCPSCGHEW